VYEYHKHVENRIEELPETLRSVYGSDDHVTFLSEKMECPVFGIHTSFNELTTPLQIHIILHRIIGDLDFHHRPVFLRVETRRFGNWMFPSSGEGEYIYSVGPLRKS
jgi:hypothetical protein